MFNKKISPQMGAIAIVVLLIASFSAVYKFVHKKTIFEVPNTIVTTEKVSKSDMNIRAKFVCRARTSQSVTLISELPGKIVDMKPDGSMVKKGDILVKLDSKEAEGKYESALARYNEEEHKLNNLKMLKQEEYVSKKQIEEQEHKKAAAKGEMRSAQAQLEKFTIKAPFDGKIGLNLQPIGATVNYQTKLLSITNFNDMEIEMTLSETELRTLGGVESLKDAIFSVSFSKHDLDMLAKYSASEALINLETNSIVIRAKLIDQNPNVLPGQIGEVVIIVGTKQTLNVPETAVEEKQGNGEDYVFIVKENTAIQTPVEIGMKDGSRVEILKGLKEGDVVVTSGCYNLVDGQAVTI